MTGSHKFFENRDCKYFPCHSNVSEKGFNCLFCYCPMYNLTDCPGNPAWKEREGRRIKVCTACSFPHDPDNYDRIIELLRTGEKK